MHLDHKEELAKRGIIWFYDYSGDPKKPHAILHSGRHSDGFTRPEIITKDPDFLNEICNDLITITWSKIGNIKRIKKILSLDLRSNIIAYNMALRLGQIPQYGNTCLHGGYVIEECNLPSRPSMDIRTGEEILLITNFFSETIFSDIPLIDSIIMESGGNVLPYVATFMNQSGIRTGNNKEILALVNRKISKWVPDECPLCKNNSSPAVSIKNWDFSDCPLYLK
ncbi:MAG: hypothetical protein WCS86_00375 [Candidatus Paceibacterota bacterium]